MKRIGELKSWIAGINSGSKKLGPPYSFAFGRSIDFRSDQSQFTINPRPVKISNSVVTDLPMCADIANNNLFFYGKTGKIYNVDTDDIVTHLYTAPNSQGNGLVFFPEDKRLYYANNNSLGYYGSLSSFFSFNERWSSSTISDNWYDWSSGQVSINNNALEIESTLGAGFYGIELAAPRDLTDYSISNQLVDVGSRFLSSYEVYPIYVTIYGDTSNQLFWFIDASNTLRAYKKVNGANTILASGTYDPAVHKYFRIREASGTAYFDYSLDGQNWTNFTSTANPFSLTSTTIGMQVGTSSTEAATTHAVFDNFSFYHTDNPAVFVDNFLESQGGNPTNTHSLQLLAALQQSATRADTTSLSLTGDLTIEAAIKMLSLPTGTGKMSIVGKWDESGTLRSYKLEIVPTSASFGDGSDGNLTISASQTETVIDANCIGTAGTNILTLTNITGSFAVGQRIFIHQSRGSGAGQHQETEVIGVDGAILTLADNLTFSPLHSTNPNDANKAQVRVMKQYINGTVNASVTWSAKAWDGFKGGIGFKNLFSGTFTNNGTITGSGLGFRGGIGVNSFDERGWVGEGTGGPSFQQATQAPTPVHNGNGGGSPAFNNSSIARAGAGGGNGTRGGDTDPATGGDIVGTPDLSIENFGGGGGGGVRALGAGTGAGTGGPGGSIIDITAAIFINNGTISNNGNNGGLDGNNNEANGGAGAGGSVRIITQSFSNTGTITASGGIGYKGGGSGGIGNGGDGRIHIEYLIDFANDDTITPTANTAQNDNIGTANGFAVRLYISNNGTNFETYTYNIDNPLGFFRRFSVSWKASESLAKFYQNGELLGTRSGSLTAIHDNATEFAIGTSKNGSGTRDNFLNALVDDVRIFNVVRTASEIKNFNKRVLTGGENGLVAYYKFDNNLEDSQVAGNNDLTGNNTPTFSTDIAFKGVTSRNDEDVFIDTSGQTYTLGTSLNEGATHRQTFVPTKEPLKSLALNIDNVGTGDWTAVLHDSVNNEIASITVPNANLQNGVYEFILEEVVRPVRNAPYHLHVYDTTGDGAIVSGTTNDMETAYLKTFFQILVDDEYHPMKQFINFLVIGNERYVATLEAGSIYNPHRLTLPSGYRVRALAFWRDYIAIGTWKGENVTDTDQGKIFFWDGTSDRYVEPLDIPQGAINALFGTQGTLTIAAGYKGKILEYTGGDKARNKFQLPEMAKTDYAEIAPNAITMWDSMVRIGATLNTNSRTIHQGIYTWGQNEDEDPMSLGFDPLSLGDQQSLQVKTGCLITRAQKLYAGFQNGNAFGIDVTDPNAAPYQTATIELLLTDFGTVPGPKLPLVFRADFEELLEGQSYTLKYKPNRAANWLTIATQDRAGATELRGIINQRLKEAQFACDIVTNDKQVTTTSLSLETEGEETSRRI